MASNSLFPGYVLISYHSAYGAHKMILPARAWSATNITGTMGSYVGWNTTPIDAEAMIDAWVAKIKVVFLPTTEFETATVYTLASTTASAIPMASKSLAVAGTSVLTTQAKAAMTTWSFKDTSFNVSKLVFLDAPVNAGFEPIFGAGVSGAAADIVTEWTASFNAWSSRAGNRPNNIAKIVYKLSDALRRRYGMA